MNTMKLSDDLNREPRESMECDLWGEPEISPRIGDKYQVEIPVLLEKSEYISPSIGDEYNVEINVLLEKSEYIYRNRMEVQSHTLKLFTEESSCVDGNSRHEKKDKLGSESSKLTKSINDQSEVSEVEPSHDLVSGSPRHSWNSWNKADKASFLFGLYIFARNFVQVKRFLVSKRMQDILSFYYGEFYHSPEYFRWSKYQKVQKMKGVVGQKIFTRSRKQELLSRILSGMSAEGKNDTLQVWKMFAEGKIEFEEFIFSIKDLVGINALVEAVGIGKGKKDLTTKPSRSNQFIGMLPSGKALSSLKLSEIVKYLNGDYRLTKAHSYDLFWEAVWPRLLARGWNSEQPKGQIYTGSPNTLVFLVPGITKFCRRSLKKGIHYFDCETDVLNKVASDTCLMELESDEDESKGNEEEREMMNEGGNLTSQKHRYLQPRTTNHTIKGMKFTIVDTSLGDGKPYKVRELSGLFFDISHKLNSTRDIESIDDNICEFLVEELGDVDTNEACSTDDSKGSVNLPNLADLSNRKDLDMGMQILRPCPDYGNVHANENEDSGKVEKQRKTVKLNFNRMKEDNLHNIAPIIKRRRLSACDRAETRNAMTSMVDVPVKRGQEISGPVMMNIPAVSVEVTPGNQIFCSTSNAFLDSQAPQIQNTFDLNLIPDCKNEMECNGEPDEIAKGQLNDVNIQRRGTRNLIPDCENEMECNGEPDEIAKGQLNDVNIQRRGTRNTDCENEMECNREPDEIAKGQLNDVNIQRRGTRNRPPTVRALEAVACGFLSMNSKQRDRTHKLTSRPSRRAQGRTEVSNAQINRLAPTILDSQSDPSSNNNKSKLGDFQVLPKENGTSFPLLSC